MPRLPSEQDLGKISGFDSGRSVATVDLSAGAKGLESFGRSLERTSDTLGKMQAATETQRDTEEVTRANGHFRTKVAELDNKYSLANDADYGTWKQRHDEELRKAATEAAGMISSQGKRSIFSARLDGEVPQYNLSIAQRAQGIDRETRRTGFEQTLEQNVGLATSGDPSRGDAIMAETKAAIDSAVRTGIYTPAQGMQRWEQLRNKRAGIVVEKDIEADPESARIKLGRGVTRDVVSRIIGVESGGDPNAKNPKSSASGLGQFIDGTWMQFIGDKYPDLAANRREALALKTDPGMAREATEWYARKNSGVLRSNGIQDTPGNIYLAHFAGPQGAVALNKAAPDASVDGVLGQDVVNANPFLRGKNVQWVKDWAGKKMEGTNYVPSGQYADLTLDQRRVYSQRAESLAVRRDNEESATLKNLMADDLNSIRATGQPVQDLNIDRLAARMGREAAAQHMRERDAEMSYFGAVKDFDTMTPRQIGEAVGGLEPEGGTVGFTEKQGVHQRAQKLADQTIKKRNDDPAAAVDRHPIVSEALAAKNADPKSPDAWRALSKARMVAQRAIGVPESAIAPISNAEGVALFAPVINAPEGQEVPALRELAKQFDEIFGEHAPKAYMAALSASNLDKQSREVAAGLLRKIGMGKTPTKEDAAKFQEAQAQDAANRAAGNVTSDLQPIDDMSMRYLNSGPDLPKPTKNIPPDAVEFLQKNPASAEAFMKKYSGPEYPAGYAQNVIEKMGLAKKKAAPNG